VDLHKSIEKNGPSSPIFFCGICLKGLWFGAGLRVNASGLRLRLFREQEWIGSDGIALGD
jgi:hypothetical protein